MSGDVFAKINLVAIVAEHFRSLRDVTTKKVLPTDIGLFYVVPVLPLFGMLYYSVKLTDSTISVLATALSILAGLLFNLLVLLHTLSIPSTEDPNYAKLLTRFINELHANIAYSIVVSLLTLVPLVWASYYGPDDLRRTTLGDVSVYLSGHFALTMGMVLKRMDTMLKQRMSTP